jgi:hypothetical protein
MINFRNNQILKHTKLFEGTYLIWSIDQNGENCYSAHGEKISKSEYETLLVAKKNKRSKPFTSTKLVTRPLLLVSIEQNGDELVVDAGDVVARCFEEPSLVDINLNPILDIKQFKKLDTVRLSLEYITYNVAGKESTLVNLRSMQLVKSGL